MKGNRPVRTGEGKGEGTFTRKINHLAHPGSDFALIQQFTQEVIQNTESL